MPFLVLMDTLFRQGRLFSLNIISVFFPKCLFVVTVTVIFINDYFHKLYHLIILYYHYFILNINFIIIMHEFILLSLLLLLSLSLLLLLLFLLLSLLLLSLLLTRCSIRYDWGRINFHIIQVTLLTPTYQICFDR